MLIRNYGQVKKFKFLILFGMAGCLFLQAGCGLAKRLVRPFPKKREVVTEIEVNPALACKGGVKKEKGLYPEADWLKKVQGKIEIVKKINSKDLNLPPGTLPLEEKLVYGVKWRGVPIGEVELKIDGIYQLNNGRIVYRLIYEASTNPLFDVIYKVRDQVVSYFDYQELLPWKTEKNLREGGYRRVEIVEIDWDKHQAYFITSNPPEAVEIGLGAQDILSCFYYFRTRDIEVGKSQKMTVFSDQKNWELEIKALKRERVKTYLGKSEAILLEPEAKFRGIFFRKAKVQLYIKDDQSKTPLIITAKRPFFGSITATLIKKVDRL